MIPRRRLIKQIIKPSQGIPAYSFLMPGFPASNSQGLKDIQNYDPAAAKQLLADAGFPGGKGFPKLTLWLRNEAPVRQAVAQAIAASIKQNLGINVDVSNKETKTFTDATERQADPDPVRHGLLRLGLPRPVQHAQRVAGRRPPQLEERPVRRAGQEGRRRSPATRPTRIKMFQDAEKLLVTDVGGVFIYHRTSGRPVQAVPEGHRAGAGQERLRRHPLAGLLQPTATVIGSMYISKDVASSSRKLPYAVTRDGQLCSCESRSEPVTRNSTTGNSPRVDYGHATLSAASSA